MSELSTVEIETPAATLTPEEYAVMTQEIRRGYRALKDREAPLPIEPGPKHFVEETGEFLLSRYGSIWALGFKGDYGFVQRSHAWAINTGIARGNLRWMYGLNGKIAYVAVKEEERILKGLAAQFYAEIIRDKEIAPLDIKMDLETEMTEVVYDEIAIESLAYERAVQFYETRVVCVPFMESQVRGLAPVYSMSEEQWGGFRSRAAMGSE